jgi:hypothetical protein
MQPVYPLSVPQPLTWETKTVRLALKNLKKQP